MEVGLAVVAVAAAAFAAFRLRRRHRGVPRGWQTDQSEAADLHRRQHRRIDVTRREIARAGGRDAPVDRLVAFVDDLEAQARAIDAQLVAASRLPGRERARALRALRERVVEVERLAGRVDRLAADLSGPTLGAADAGLRELRDQLDALDAARREAHDIGGAEPPPAGDDGAY